MKINITVRCLFFASACLVVVPRLAHAGPIIFVDDSNGNIGTVNIGAGTSTLIGPSGVGLTDIAFTSSGAMFGTDFTTLYSVNAATGHATAIGAEGATNGMNALVGNGSGLLGASNNTTSLYSVNPATGAATALTGANTLTSAGDLAFYKGLLYETALNGTGTDLLAITLSGSTFTSVDLGQVVNDTQLFGLVQASDGNLYGVDGQRILLINTVNPGLSTVVVNNYGGAGLGAAFGAASATEATVPEPTSLLLLASGLLGAGARRWKQRCNIE